MPRVIRVTVVAWLTFLCWKLPITWTNLFNGCSNGGCSMSRKIARVLHLFMPPSHDLQSMCARPVCSMHIGCVPARLLQLAWITDPVLCMCVYFCVLFCGLTLLRARSYSDNGRVHATASYVTRFAKRDHIPYLNCIYCKEAYFCNAMRNLNQVL